jgi:hypothetical protein
MKVNLNYIDIELKEVKLQKNTMIKSLHVKEILMGYLSLPLMNLVYHLNLILLIILE